MPSETTKSQATRPQGTRRNAQGTNKYGLKTSPTLINICKIGKQCEYRLPTRFQMRSRTVSSNGTSGTEPQNFLIQIIKDSAPREPDDGMNWPLTLMIRIL